MGAAVNGAVESNVAVISANCAGVTLHLIQAVVVLVVVHTVSSDFLAFVL